MVPGRVAVFVDGDNISSHHADEIHAFAKHFGPVDLQRVYGDAVRLPGWQDLPGFRLIHAGTGKNATDLLLAIEAMEHGITGSFATLVIASSDGDFTHLATRLRERGVRIVGVGEEKAPVRFRSACCAFLQVGGSCAVRTPDNVVVYPQKPTQFDWQIHAQVTGDSAKGNGIRIADLALRMRHKHGTLISSLPEKKWRVYLQARNTLYDLDPRGPKAKVRVRRDGFDTSCIRSAVT